MIFVERDAGKVKGRSTHSWMNRTDNGCLAKGEGTFKKNSQFQVRIESTTSVTPIAACLHPLSYRRDVSKLVRLPGFLFTQTVSLALRAPQQDLH